MIAKKTVVVIKPFRDRDGKEHKVGERIEVDPDYGQEIIRDGSVKEDAAHPDQSLPTPPKAEPKG
jgi:hypothetical protein